MNVDWWWRYEKADGTVLAQGDGQQSSGKAKAKAAALPEEKFTTQGDAESWIGESWRELLEGGVDRVTLLEGDRVEYGPMSLHPTQ